MPVDDSEETQQPSVGSDCAGVSKHRRFFEEPEEEKRPMRLKNVIML